MSRPTLKQVAHRANVSVATASLVLSGKSEARVSPETEARVHAAALELGYRANRLARSLRQQSTRVLGLLSIEVATTPYAGALLRSAQAAARASDYDILFHEISSSVEDIRDGLDLLADHRVDGVLIASYFHRVLSLPESLPTNLVLADATAPGVDSIVPNEYESVAFLMNLLAEQGHTRVGYIGDSSGFPASKERKRAFLDAAATHGWVAADSAIELREHTDTPDGYEAFDRLWQRRPDLTAVFCFTDRMAFGVYERARELGLDIPSRLSVVGFDDQLLISGALRPGLTTVALPHEQMGRWAVERLIERCQSAESIQPSQVSVIGELVVRESVAAAASDAHIRPGRRRNVG